MILFSEVIVFFFLLSYLSKNLIPLQKQHPRSVGNRPFKRKSMPYSIILDSMRSLRYKTTWPFWVAYFSFPSHRPWKRIPLFFSLKRKLVVLPRANFLWAYSPIHLSSIRKSTHNESEVMRTQKQQQHFFRFRLAYIAFSSRYTWNQSLPIRWKANRSCLRASLQCCSLLHLIQDPMLRLAASADALCLGTYFSYVVSTDGTWSPCASDRDRARNSPANEVKTEWTVGRAGWSGSILCLISLWCALSFFLPFRL